MLPLEGSATRWKGDVGDMRHLRVTFGLAAIACAFALAATPALAHEFVASQEGKTKGSIEKLQEFKFGPFNLRCEKVGSKGYMSGGSTQILSTAIKPGKCLTVAHMGGHEFFLSTAWKIPLALEYHANGYVKTGSTVVNVEGKWVVGGPAAMFKVHLGKTEEFESSSCEVLIPPGQVLPAAAAKKPEEQYEAASFLNKMFPHKISNRFPTGEQPGIMITNEIKGFHAEFVGEPCEEWGHEEEETSLAGYYKGSFPQVLAPGTLYWY
jgi:hypothetical protein